MLIIFDKVFNSSEPAMGNNYGKTHESIFSRKASIECFLFFGGGGGEGEFSRWTRLKNQ